jgi:hypothetical protein
MHTDFNLMAMEPTPMAFPFRSFDSNPFFRDLKYGLKTFSMNGLPFTFVLFIYLSLRLI